MHITKRRFVSIWIDQITRFDFSLLFIYLKQARVEKKRIKNILYRLNESIISVEQRNLNAKAFNYWPPLSINAISMNELKLNRKKKNDRKSIDRTEKRWMKAKWKKHQTENKNVYIRSQQENNGYFTSLFNLHVVCAFLRAHTKKKKKNIKMNVFDHGNFFSLVESVLLSCHFLYWPLKWVSIEIKLNLYRVISWQLKSIEIDRQRQSCTIWFCFIFIWLAVAETVTATSASKLSKRRKARNDTFLASHCDEMNYMK